MQCLLLPVRELENLEIKAVPTTQQEFYAIIQANTRKLLKVIRSFYKYAKRLVMFMEKLQLIIVQELTFRSQQRLIHHTTQKQSTSISSIKKQQMSLESFQLMSTQVLYTRNWGISKKLVLITNSLCDMPYKCQAWLDRAQRQEIQEELGQFQTLERWTQKKCKCLWNVIQSCQGS